MTNTVTVHVAGTNLKNKLKTKISHATISGMGYLSEKDIELEATKIEEEQMEFEFYTQITTKENSSQPS